jgi:transposase-like protein
VRCRSPIARQHHDGPKRRNLPNLPNRKSCLRHVTALAAEQSEELREQRRLEDLVIESEEVMIMES